MEAFLRLPGTALTICLLVLLNYPLRIAWGHDHYSGWQRPDGKGSCCNNQDCRPVAHRDTPAGAEVRIDELGGAWHAVPPRAVLPFGSPDDRAHACYGLIGCQSARGCQPHFYCVALPAAM
jgi:hypothetical protein